MATQESRSPAEQISCEVCLKEVPKSEATVAEAADYFAYFCGLECFEKWKAEEETPKPPGSTPA